MSEVQASLLGAGIGISAVTLFWAGYLLGVWFTCNQFEGQIATLKEMIK